MKKIVIIAFLAIGVWFGGCGVPVKENYPTTEELLVEGIGKDDSCGVHYDSAAERYAAIIRLAKEANPLLSVRDSSNCSLITDGDICDVKALISYGAIIKEPLKSKFGLGTNIVNNVAIAVSLHEDNRVLHVIEGVSKEGKWKINLLL